MKNRRLTILFAVMVLAGSPQVWQQLGKLVDAVQHKVHIKFLSMVLSPQTGSDEVLTSQASQVEHYASCQSTSFDQAQVDSKARTDSSPRKLKTDGRAALRLEEQVTLSPKDIAKVEREASSLRLDNLARAEQNRLTMHGMTPVPTDVAMNKSNVVEVVVVPRIDSFGPAFIDSASLFKLKKTLEENKFTRQKTRYLISRPVLAPPSSKADAVGIERAG